MFINVFPSVLLRWWISFATPLLLTERHCSSPHIYCSVRNWGIGHWRGRTHNKFSSNCVKIFYSYAWLIFVVSNLRLLGYVCFQAHAQFAGLSFAEMPFIKLYSEICLQPKRIEVDRGDKRQNNCISHLASRRLV